MYVDYGNIFDGRLHAFQKNTEGQVVASNKSGINVNADKNITWSCFQIGMQNEVVFYRLILFPSKGWKRLFFFSKNLKHQNSFPERNLSRE